MKQPSKANLDLAEKIYNQMLAKNSKTFEVNEIAILLADTEPTEADKLLERCYDAIENEDLMKSYPPAL